MPQKEQITSVASLSLSDQKRFIDALAKDINSSMHGMETNYFALENAILLIHELKSGSALSLEQLIRGALNYAVLCEHNKYGMITTERVGAVDAKRFYNTTKQWFKNVTPTVDTIKAIKDNEERRRAEFQAIRQVIQNAAQSPLFIMPGCVFNTLAVYFEYVKNLKADFPVPELPVHPVNRAHPLMNKRTPFKLLIVDQQVTNTKNVKTDNQQQITEGVQTNNKNTSKTDPLAALKQQVNDATTLYVNYSNSIWFSLFHRHGATGRTRAQKFNEQFQKIDNFEDAQKALTAYLNDKTQGNTHPHSYRTMLLTELLGKEKNSYKAVSGKYQEALTTWSTQWTTSSNDSKTALADPYGTTDHYGL